MSTTLLQTKKLTATRMCGPVTIESEMGGSRLVRQLRLESPERSELTGACLVKLDPKECRQLMRAMVRMLVPDEKCLKVEKALVELLHQNRGEM